MTSVSESCSSIKQRERTNWPGRWSDKDHVIKSGRGEQRGAGQQHSRHSCGKTCRATFPEKKKTDGNKDAHTHSVYSWVHSPCLCDWGLSSPPFLRPLPQPAADTDILKRDSSINRCACQSSLRGEAGLKTLSEGISQPFVMLSSLILNFYVTLKPPWERTWNTSVSVPLRTIKLLDTDADHFWQIIRCSGFDKD